MMGPVAFDMARGESVMSDELVVDADLVDEPVRGDLATRTEPPVRWVEWAALLLLIALADMTVYRGNGYAGYAVLFGVAPWILWCGAPRGRTWQGGRPRMSLLCAAVMLLLLAGRLLWCGWAWNILVGFALLMAFSLALSGVVPYVLEVAVFPARVILGGLLGLAAYVRSVRWPALQISRMAGLSILLPVVTFLAFSLLFILANPDLLNSFGEQVSRFLQGVRAWLIDYSPEPVEFLFWCFAGWIALGMMRPLLSGPLFEEWAREEQHRKRGGAPSPSPLYAACRNTLLTVIVLFAGYLIFEYRTLWFREFPPGFYYSGYAHQGAAWLTVALALATGVLSLAFRGTILHDPRRRALRGLAWLWSLENVLLALAVYHRLFIYVGFNGMTRMRIVGFFGITAVLIGFLLVLWKIAHDRGALWLLRRHLWTVAIAVYLYSIMPVDVVVVRYNVQLILGGDMAPSVQISVHPISAEGLQYLAPVMDCSDPIIREGVTAYLAQQLEDAEVREARRRTDGWTAFQMADQKLLSQLQGLADRLAAYRDSVARKAAIDRFDEYAYQWF
jgi:hypothetical protein